MGFKPKDKQERTIPIPDARVKMLLRHRKTQAAGTSLVFPTSEHLKHQGRPGGQRDRHMMDRSKARAPGRG